MPDFGADRELSGRFAVSSASRQHLSKDDAFFLLEAMDASIMCREREELGGLLADFGKLFGADHFFCLLAGFDSNGRIEDADGLSDNLSDSWFSSYLEKKDYQRDRRISEHFSSYGLRHWDGGAALPGPGRRAHQGICTRGYSCGARCSSGESSGSLFYFGGAGVAAHLRTEMLLTYAVPFLHEALVRILRATSAGPNILTLREREILGLIRNGRTDQEAAGHLGISCHTVKFHVKNILYKMDVASRSHAVALALRKKFID